MSSGRRLDLSVSQLVAGALATCTATVGASFLGISGTLVGAGVMSVMTTMGGAVYQHFFHKTGTKLREAGQVAAQRTVVPRGRAVSPRTQTGRSDRPSSAETTTADPTTMMLPKVGRGDGRDEATPDTQRYTTQHYTTQRYTTEQPTARQDGQTDRPGTGAAPTPAAPSTTGADAPTEAFDVPGGSQPGPAEVTRSQPPSDQPTALGSPVSRFTAARPGMTAEEKRRWLVRIAAAAGIFVVVMGGITIAEKLMHKPIAAAVQGKRGTGTSLGGGQVGSHRQVPVPGPTTSTPVPTNTVPGGGSQPTGGSPSTPNPDRSASRAPAPPDNSPRPTPSTKGSSSMHDDQLRNQNTSQNQGQSSGQGQ